MNGKKGWAMGVLIFLIIMVLIVLGTYFGYLFFRSSEKESKGDTVIEVVSNPMNSIKNNYIHSNGSGNLINDHQNNESLESYNVSEVIDEGVREFNESYMDYILLGLGVDKLHGAIGFGNPIIITVVSGEEWNSEIINKFPKTLSGHNGNGDIKVILSKEEAVRAILSEDIKIFMKNSVTNGNTGIEMVAGNAELFGKGYLGLYNDLTGNTVLKVNSQW
jgi:hypothetical protein